MFARRCRNSGSGGRCDTAGCGGAGIRDAAPCGKVVDAALVVVRCVRGEVIFYGLLAVADRLQFRSYTVGDTAGTK